MKVTRPHKVEIRALLHTKTYQMYGYSIPSMVTTTATLLNSQSNSRFPVKFNTNDAKVTILVSFMQQCPELFYK